MALAQSGRASARIISSRLRVAPVTAVRQMAGGVFEDREKGEESAFFRRQVVRTNCSLSGRSSVLRAVANFGPRSHRFHASFVPHSTQEREQLEKLLSKMKKVEDSGKQELLAILGPHKLPEDIIQKLLTWKGHF